MSDFREGSGEKKEIDSTTLREAEDRMGIARARLLLRQPFYGVLLSMTDFVAEGSIPTMATDGVKVYYSPEFVKGLTESEIYGVLMHEINHCIYLHCTSKRRMNRDSHRWNVACDFAINLEIRDMQLTLPRDTLLDEKYRDMNAEQIYDDLPEDSSQFQTFDIHIENSDHESWDDMEDKIVTAYEMTKDSKQRGNLPSGLKRWIDKLKKSKVKWERIFHRFVGQALAKDDYSFARPNRRHLAQDIYLPELRNHIIGSVVIAVDTSGSVGVNQLEQFAAEIGKVGHLVDEVTVMSCDARVHEVIKVRRFQDFLSGVNFEFQGGGGTAFEPVFEKIDELKIIPELLIYLTDTYGSFPEKAPSYPVLWCVTVSPEQASNIPFGKTIYLPIDGDTGW